MKRIIQLTEAEIKGLIRKILNEQDFNQSEIDEVDYESYMNSEAFAPLRDAIRKNKTVSVVFVKKDGTVRPMAIRRSLSAHVFSDAPKSQAQQDIGRTYDLKRFIDINAYIKNKREMGDPEAAAKASWRTVPLRDTLGFLAGGHFVDVRDENQIRERFGEEVYNSLTPNMIRAVELQQQNAEQGLEHEVAGGEEPEAPEAPAEPIAETKKRIIRLTETDLREMVNKALNKTE